MTARQPTEAELKAALDRMLEVAQSRPHHTASGRMTIPRFKEDAA